MRFTVPSSSFTAALSQTARASSPRHALPALSGVRLTVSDDQVELAATDNRLSVRINIEATGTETGSALVPAKLFSDVCKAFGGDSISCLAEDSELVVTSGKSVIRLRLLRLEDFPLLPNAIDADEQSFVLPSEQWISAMNSVLSASSRDETRPTLTGVLVDIDKDQLTTVATDSYRLALRQTALEDSIGETAVHALVPASTCTELKLLATQHEKLECALRESVLVAQAGNVVISSSLLDGSFPPYEKLLPEAYEHTISLSRDALLDMVKRIALLSPKGTPLQVEFSADELTVTAHSPDIGQAVESMSIKGGPDEKVAIGFNTEYLRDGIALMSSGDIEFKVISPLRPGMLSDGDTDYLLMPVRLNV